MALRPATPLRGLALCAGAGGLELALHIAVPSYRTVCYVEREAYAAAALVARMEDASLDPAPIWDDLATFNGRRWRGAVDIVSAGYPCQPFSQAGRRLGTKDPRHLWPHVRRVIVQSRPSIVFLENVPAHLTLGYPLVRGQLQALGFRVAEGLYSAEEVGASQRRERLFILAHGGSRERSGGRADARRSSRAVSGDCHEAVACSHGEGLSHAEPAGEPGTAQCREFPRPTAFKLCGARLAGEGLPLFAPGPADHGAWVELLTRDPSLVPAVRRALDGVAYRVERLRLGGNGVCSLAGARAFGDLAIELGIA